MNNSFKKAQDLYKDKRVLILGLGINQGGVGATKFMAQVGANVRVTDLKSKEELKNSLDQLKVFSNIDYILGKHRNQDIDWADIIIRNPAIKPGNPYLEYALSHNKTVEMDLGIFVQFISPEKIIGVTGTKGKSTTASLITKALEAGNIPVVFAGNIGKSMFDVLEVVKDDTLVVLELSSFQLQGLVSHQVSPKYSVITNIYPDHLNYHSSMEEYIETKRLIAKFQKNDGFLFLNKDDKITNTLEFIKGLNSQIVYFSADDLPEGFHPKLLGKHNLLNSACALKVAATFNIDLEKAKAAIENFEGIDFRMQLIGEFNGINVYNDTTATSPQAAIWDIMTLSGCILIAGGTNKSLPYKELAKTIDQHAKSVYFLMGDATDQIKKYITKTEKIKGEYNNLETLVRDVLREAKSGDIVLFSPGAASFNLFKNEFDRGRQFNEVVQKLVGTS